MTKATENFRDGESRNVDADRPQGSKDYRAPTLQKAAVLSTITATKAVSGAIRSDAA